MRLWRRKEKPRAVLELNDYQAVNLRAALDAICLSQTPNPLSALDSGDWALEVRFMLPPLDAAEYEHGPNRLPEESIAESVRRASYQLKGVQP